MTPLHLYGRKRTFRHPYLIEPAMVLYMLTRWCLRIGHPSSRRVVWKRTVHLTESYTSRQIRLEDSDCFANYTDDVE